MSRKQAIKSAKRNVNQLGKLFASLGTKEHPRGKILVAYRQSHRALRDVIRREAFNEVSEVMAILEADVSEAARDALQKAAIIGHNAGDKQLRAYGVEVVESEDPGIGLMADAWTNLVRDQSFRSRALLIGGGDPILIIGDQSRQGIVRPGTVISEGTRWLAMAAALTWAGVVSRSADRAKMTFMRQAVAAIDEKTTNCCLQVHGQVVAMEGRFHLTGTPRFADYMKDPPFHYNCRTSQVLIKPEETGDELTQAMEEASRGEFARRAEGEPPGEGPVSALGRARRRKIAIEKAPIIIAEEEKPRRFSEASEADEWAESVESLNPTLTEDQDEAMQQYKGEDFSEVNDELRMAGSSEMRLASDPDQYLDELIESSFEGTNLPEPITVYRGADWDVFEDFDDLTGDTISDDAFVSTSMIRRIAEAHSDGLVMEIRLPKGAQAIYMDKWKVSGWETESELLLPKGSKFKVISDINRPDEYEREMIVELIL